MARQLRIDYSSLRNVERTPQGGIRVGATLARAGVLVYQTPTGPIREWAPQAEVSRADSLQTLRGAPVTNNHPPSKIGPHNFRQHTMGHVGDDVRMEGPQVAASLYVQDAEAIRAIEAGRQQGSCGYHTDVDETPGVVPEGEPDAGKPYDRVQRNRTYNHFALVDLGRAGDAQLRLDSAGDAVTDERKDKGMNKEYIDGIEYEVGTPAHKGARERRDAADVAQRDELAKLRKDVADEKARADKAVERHDSLAAHVKKMATPENFDKAVAARAQISDKARTILGKEFKTDGLTNLEIKKAAVGKARPDLKLDGASRDFINGAWHALPSTAAKGGGSRNDAADQLLRATAPMSAITGQERNDAGALVETRTVAQIRHDSIEDGSMRSGRPLAMSRRDRFKEQSNHPMLQSAQIETMK